MTDLPSPSGRKFQFCFEDEQDAAARGRDELDELRGVSPGNCYDRATTFCSGSLPRRCLALSSLISEVDYSKKGPKSIDM